MHQVNLWSLSWIVAILKKTGIQVKCLWKEGSYEKKYAEIVNT